MGQRRLPNIDKLCIKRIERGEDEFKQFLNNSWSYRINTIEINECKLSSIDGDTFEDMVKMCKYNLEDQLDFEGVVANTREITELLDVSKKI